MSATTRDYAFLSMDSYHGLVILIGLLLGMLTPCMSAHAEGGCPAGMIPYRGTDISSCGPIPGYDQQQPAQAPVLPAPRWESRWGAIATDAESGTIGSSSGELTADEAEQHAMADCKAKGGGICTLQISYSNGCGVLMLGRKGFNFNWGDNESTAIKKAMDVCRASDTDCHVHFKSCSPAARGR